ncbi:phage portal protein [Siminovitchia fortis]|uniref:Phage portal protein n=1 Tax=Siminovitchia fortis TaxID=254758 RepID=A0A443IMN1_9BACI|nr:phage portal protein [Siminovitchia fortis]RWR06742.1 phage portal protein [Siminovitchia fortis]WHY83010.1 phage portal protein [Siminovitchia fortis]
MKWFNKFKAAAKGAAAGWKGKMYDFSSWFGRTFFGVDNSKLATNETIFSVISRLANTVSSLPIKLHQNYDLKTNQAYDVLVNVPNQNMSGFDFINKMEVSRNEHGNAYALIMRDIRLQVEALIPIDPTYITPFLNTDDESLWYQVLGTNGTYYIHNMNMLHVKHITGASRWQGISPLEVLKNTLLYDKAVQEFSLTEMKKPDSFVLKYGTNVDDEKRDEVTKYFREFYKNNGGILFQEPGVEIDPIEKKYFASDTLKSEKITRSRVANVFNVPVSFLNDDEGQSYSSNEQMMIQFVQMTLTPIVRQYEHEFNRKLLTEQERRQGYYFKFNLNGLLRGDMAARTNFYQAGVRGGWLKPDEIRMYEDLPPEGGNAAELFVSGDLYPISMDPRERRKGGDRIGQEPTKE